MSDNPERVHPMLLDFVRKEYISKNLLRVTVTGNDLIGFPEDQNGAHIKLFFANRETGILQLPFRDGEIITWPEHKPVARAYSVRRYRSDKNELDIDFVIHGNNTPGGGWAAKAKKGDTIGLIGPAGPNPLLEPADWYIIAGDLTAVPAISAILEELPSDSKGYAFIEIDEIEDRHDINHPEGVLVDWIVRQPKSGRIHLLDAINGIAPPEGVSTISAFIAGENESVIACRKKLKQDYQLSKKNMYAIPYWKRGKDEEAYHAERHEVMDEEY
ncbi:Vulnibactin utilization protein viuB [Vibrio nigripulchritudo SFn27]|uniref:Vulnibactin utilization protein viuB n=1 Tax=Vibrio nigripulchritudo TaxID=28173 RepID=U4KBY1_9VIBR|nr:siderophore-interacting protein [Vibrio nigripulchritudo]CCN80834.1 Vulnibactin utilization protein viuB [Vibrio nigripulchritudo BLFn1]CCN88050.1 Vulnibactin utilization protein viuB [Vibrio nigripulchritudo SFn27]CCN96904.1 Vulnibactin utilization protein viuB [Vibrio nigripulchritudo ENn2]CCO43443.1 Vulnibactin utilization protein viuB [Vibrio nigripulchritudo SFn135]CCO51652.1 Vulnibactin utilization protein viuB [Vibrio nigripulchritudo Wn13]